MNELHLVGAQRDGRKSIEPLSNRESAASPTPVACGERPAVRTRVELVDKKGQRLWEGETDHQGRVTVDISEFNWLTLIRPGVSMGDLRIEKCAHGFAGFAAGSLVGGAR